MSTTRLLTTLSRVHSDGSVNEQVLELEGLDEVGVPDHAAVSSLDVSERANALIDLGATLLEGGLGAEDGSVVLHDALHVAADLGSAEVTLGEAELVKAGKALLAGVGGKGLVGSVGLEDLTDTVGASTTEDDDIEEGVGTKTVGTMDRGASSLTSSHETANNLVRLLGSGLEDLTLVVGGNTTHVVVNGGEDGNRLLSNINTGENSSGLRDTGETLSKEFRGKMVEVEENVVLLGTNTTALADLHGHGTRNDVTRGKILGSGGITLHETLTLAVTKDTTLTTRALSNQATSTVDTGRVELNELKILERNSGTGSHGITVTSASVGRGGREVSAPVTTSGKDGLVGLEAVKGAILHAEGNDTTADTLVVHDEVEGKVLDVEIAVPPHGLTIESVEHGVTSTISGAGATVSLATPTVVKGLTTEGTLINLSILSTRKGETVVLKLPDGLGGLTTHVLNSILVTEPVATLNGIVGVPPPVILSHVTESGINTTLGSDSVRPRGEKLGDTGSLESLLRETNSGTETSTTGTNDNSVELVVNELVSALGAVVTNVIDSLGDGRANGLAVHSSHY
mmetsp:Transcript_11997/g.21516  ORF Transcript_11997/g.21516 Transcript_11997/m.21516 type:complete len:570 (-) Transcript_11997:118-1827(-)